MKKRYLLIALAAVILSCIFTLSVGATGTNEFGVVEAIDGINLEGMSTDTEAKVVLVESDGVTYHTYPSNYIVTSSATLTFDFSRITTATYTKDSIVRFELPKGVTTINGSVIGSKTGLIEVVLGNDLTIIGKEVFNGYSALSKVTLGSKLTEIGRYAFASTGITELVIPNSVNTLGVYAFSGCRSLVSATISESLTTISDGLFEGCFYLTTTIPDNVEAIGVSAFDAACYYGGGITINKTSKLKSIGFKAFYDTQGVHGGIYLPSSLEAIGSYAFANTAFSSFENLENTQVTVLENEVFNTSAYTELRLPKNLIEIKRNAIFLNGKIYVPNTLTIVDANAFTTPWKNGLVIFTGKSADKLKITTKLADAAVIDASEYDETKSYTGFNIVINYNYCKAFNKNIHKLDSSTANIEYPDGYANSGVYSASCIACGGIEQKKTNALFSCSGYSIPEDGRGGIVIGFTVNKDAISEYENVTKKTISYGAFMVAKDRLGDNDIFSKDGEVAACVVCAEITKNLYVSFELKITGFADNQKDIKLAMGAYVAVTDGEATEYSYVQFDAPGEGEKYHFISYNEIA